MRITRIFAAMAMCLTALLGANAQQQQMPTIPLDPNVRMGKLDNGLTYYIRHNEWPEDRAEFYIAQKVGSMQEEDSQRGLAHFLEHMCFNGTTNFPGDNLKTWLESIGVKFGENLNAYTSFDETVYNISNVPVTRASVIDSCLLILHDWSSDLLLEGKEIDKERGVINEEWRMRRSAMLRMYENAFPKLYAGSRYAYRMPIGTMDVVMNFKHDELRNYYHTWYRPDLQGIVVVGDINVDEIEGKIKSMFSHIKMPANPAERVYHQVPDNDAPIIDIQKDKEQDRTMIYLMYKHDAFPRDAKNTILYYGYQYMSGAIAGMFSDRFQEMLQKENPPFLGASVSDGEYLISNTKGAFTGVTVCKDNGYKEAIAALYREMLRASRFGFTASEYERYKTDFLSQVENAYAQKDKTYSSQYVNEYVRHFLDNEPAPGIEWEYPQLKQIADMVTVEYINEAMKRFITDKNMAAVMFCPDKEGLTYPTEAEILDILKAVEAENIEPYVEEVSNEPLISNLPAPGKVKKEAKGPYESTLLTLSNGIKVYVKKTDFVPNEISMRAISDGGNSLYSDDEYINSSNASLVGIGGWGNFSAIELGKKLAGRTANVSPSVSSKGESITGGCVKKDLETLLQLTYLCFTSPRKDEAAFKSTIERYKAQLANQELDPTTALSDTIAKVLYNNNVRARRTKVEDIEKMNYDRIIEIYKERFADANDFTFFFIGDIDIETLKPLLEKYIATLPVLKSKEKFKTIGQKLAKGTITNVFEKEQQTPAANVLFMYHAPLSDDLKNVLCVDILKQIMTMVYTETVREQEGGAYGIPVSSAVSDYPEKIGLVQITLPTSPDKRQHMTEIIYKGADDMVANGPKAEDLQKVKEYMLRSYAERIKTNGYWMNQLVNNVKEGKDNVAIYEKTVNSITAADIQNMAKRIFKSGNRIEVGMTAPSAK